MDKIHERLDARGTLIIHVPNADGLNGMRMRYGDLTHEICFNPSSLSQVLRTCGFNNFKFIEDVPVVHGFKSFIRFILWKALTIVPRLTLLAETGAGNHILSQNFLAIIKK